jgi:hypothetical protein
MPASLAPVPHRAPCIRPLAQRTSRGCSRSCVINAGLSGFWLEKGLVMGGIAWMLVIPWFEFYLPYNVMHEPPALVLFEGLLWLGVMLLVGLCASLVLNVELRRAKRYRAPSAPSTATSSASANA